MQVLIKNIRECYKQMNKISKLYIKIGNVIVFSLFFLALFCYMAAGRFGNYDNTVFLMNELLTCGKEFVSAIYVPALIIEIVVLAQKSD